MSMKDRRNMCEKFDLIVSTRLESDLIDTYEGYKDMLFTYNDIKPYLDKLPLYCNEALEASGYKENAYIDNFTISKDDMYISVKHKDGNISKTYRISPDGSGIVIPNSLPHSHLPGRLPPCGRPGFRIYPASIPKNS